MFFENFERNKKILSKKQVLPMTSIKG